jgi:SAM-dependent methyltransferase
MPPTLTDQEARARFVAEQRLAFAPGRLAVERAVCGSDYGGTSWTTMAEAGRVASMLGVGPGDRLLEVGAGTGWPGLFVAQETGADLVLSDIPYLGLGAALKRGESDGLGGRVCAAAADGGALPFGDAAFDAVSHSDVLCCLPGKLATLADTRRVVRAGGRTVFSVISMPPGLTGSALMRAVEAAPPFAESDEEYPAMIERAGWEIIEHSDLTGQYLDSARVTVAAEEENGEALREVHGEEDFAARLTRRKLLVAILEEGLAKRELFVATHE